VVQLGYSYFACTPTIILKEGHIIGSQKYTHMFIAIWRLLMCTVSTEHHIGSGAALKLNGVLHISWLNL